MNNIEKVEQRVEEYFNVESSDYCAYYKKQGRQKSLMRNVSRVLFRNAIEGRRNAVVELCPRPLEGVRICEVGTGGGHYAVELASRGAQVLGLDFADKMIAHATALAASQNQSERCSFQRANIFDFRSPVKFDVIFAAGVIDYVPVERREEFVAKLASLSKGSVIVSFPKRYHVHALVRKIWLSLKQVPVSYFTSAEMIRLLESANLVPDRTIDIGIIKVIRARVK